MKGIDALTDLLNVFADTVWDAAQQIRPQYIIINDSAMNVVTYRAGKTSAFGQKVKL